MLLSPLLGGVRATKGSQFSVWGLLSEAYRDASVATSVYLYPSVLISINTKEAHTQHGNSCLVLGEGHMQCGGGMYPLLVPKEI